MIDLIGPGLFLFLRRLYEQFSINDFDCLVSANYVLYTPRADKYVALTAIKHDLSAQH